jgi:vancomycin aglycone glucosyltransferase
MGRAGTSNRWGLAVRLRALGADVRVCAPADFAERLAEVGVALVPVVRPVRPLVHKATPPSAGVPRHAVTSSPSTRHDYNANIS